MDKTKQFLMPLEEFIPQMEMFACNAFMDKQGGEDYLKTVLDFVKEVEGKAFVILIKDTEYHGHSNTMNSDTLLVCLPYLANTLPSLVNQAEEKYIQWCLNQYADEKDIYAKKYFTEEHPYYITLNPEVIPYNMMIIRLWWD